MPPPPCPANFPTSRQVEKLASRHTPPTTKDGGAPAYRGEFITPPPAARSSYPGVNLTRPNVPPPCIRHRQQGSPRLIVPVHHTPRALIPTPCFLSCDHPSRTPTTPPLRSPPSPSSSPAAVTWSVHPTTHQLPAAGGAPPDALAPCPHHQPVPTASRLRSPPIPFSYPAGKPKKCTRSSPTTQQQQGSPPRIAAKPPTPCSTASWTATTHPLPSPTITARARLTPPVSKHHPPLPPHLFPPPSPLPPG